VRISPFRCLLFLWSGLLPAGLCAQEKAAGPVITEYGEVFQVANPGFPTNTSHTFRAIFDVMNGQEDKSQRNLYFESVARFLNMHAQAGVPPEQLHAVLVVHNVASADLLTDEFYRERFGYDNPNSAMLRALMDAGVEVIFCGQSSLSRNIPIEHTVPGVKLALSAMTALIQYQDQGYRLIKY
jgi:intracellular sulfur oxidation DsrE/DsrF family protein